MKNFHMVGHLLKQSSSGEMFKQPIILAALESYALATFLFVACWIR